LAWPLLRYLLLTSDGALRSLAGASVGAGALSAHGQALAVTDALQAVDLHLALDVLGDVAATVTFDGEVLVDVGTQFVDVSFAEVLHARGLVDSRRGADLLRGRWSDTKDVRECDHRPLFAGDVDSGNTGHVLPLLALTLLVTRVLADHAHVTGPTNDLALLAHGLDAGADLHVFSFSNETETELFVPVGDASTGHVVGRDLDLDLVAGKDTDAVHAHLS